MITISEEASISELGRRSNNEDNVGSLHGCIYTVCDGVGGAEKGEIASEIVVKTFLEYFQSSESEISASGVLMRAESKLSEYLARNPDSVGMATTLTMAHIRTNGVYVAWVGDSRVYQFRGGRIIFKTKDHSWVNEALEAGIISSNEAIGHPKSNIITRAVQGSHKPARVDDVLLTDVRKDDFFLLCSDGVLETWSDEDFSALFGAARPVDEIIQNIKSECAGNSKDNSTAIVFKIGSVKSPPQTQATPRSEDLISDIQFVEAIPLEKNQLYGQEMRNSRPGNRSDFDQVGKSHADQNLKYRAIIIGFATMIIVALGIFIWNSQKETTDNVDVNVINNPDKANASVQSRSDEKPDKVLDTIKNQAPIQAGQPASLGPDDKASEKESEKKNVSNVAQPVNKVNTKTQTKGSNTISNDDKSKSTKNK